MNDVSEIDVVYTWVDGTDPQYLAERRKFMSPNEKSQMDPNRFRNNDELRYSIRSVLENTNWVRKIFIVTNNQVPSFLNLKSQKIEIVPTDQIIDDADARPNFNSMAIECCLHKIPGLSKYFIYLNDDFFVGRPLTLNELRGSHGDGLFLMEDKQLGSPASDPYQNYLRSSNEALNRVYGNFKRLNGCHVPQFFNRDVCDKVFDIWREEISVTVRKRFRSPTDVVFRLLYAYNVIYEHFGSADIYDLVANHSNDVRLARPLEYLWIPYGDRKYEIGTMLQRVKDEKILFFCLQDHMWGDLTDQVATLKEFMSSRFATKTDLEL